jgi:hypothetical protein
MELSELCEKLIVGSVSEYPPAKSDTLLLEILVEKLAVPSFELAKSPVLLSEKLPV